MRKFTSKRSALLAVIGVLVVASAAIAYFSSTGSGTGTGSATIAAGAVSVTVTPDSTWSKTGDVVTFTVNATNTGSSDVLADIDDAAVSFTDHANCPDDSFEIDEITGGPEQIAPAGNANIGTVLVSLNETDSLQDACRSGISLTVPTK